MMRKPVDCPACQDGPLALVWRVAHLTIICRNCGWHRNIVTPPKEELNAAIEEVLRKAKE